MLQGPNLVEMRMRALSLARRPKSTSPRHLSMSSQVSGISSRVGNTSKRTKLIVGLDYGTTFTGVAFVHENATDPREIKTFTDWGGELTENNEQNEKTPSIIAYADENPEQGGQDAWGADVEPGSQSYSWTKLLLDAKSQIAQYDDPTVHDSVQQGIMRLPEGKDAVQVVGDYLKKVHDHIIESFVEKCGGRDILDVTPIEYWLTVPAIWSDEAKAATRKAAQLAGFGSRPIDEVNLVAEPEAAAILALKTSVDETDSLVKAGTGVLVCDCGGGTVDVTSYTVARTSPSLVLNESCRGSGAKCGGTFIDRNLFKLLDGRFGSAFSDLPLDRTGPGSRFMVAFESRKQQFSLGNTKQSYKLPLIMPGLNTTSGPILGYDKNYHDIILTKNDLLECFSPVVTNILQLISDQVENVRRRGEPKVQTVVLVGGLGCSKYVRDCVKDWCDGQQIRMVTPWSGAWSAVARGAALHGLGSVKIQKRITRRHYGREVASYYQAGIDDTSGPRWEQRWRDPWTGNWRINGTMGWMIAKNVVFDDDTELFLDMCVYHYEGSPKVREQKLYSYSDDIAPHKLDSEGVVEVGTIVTTYDDLNLDEFDSKYDEFSSTKVWNIPFSIFIKLGSRQGTLTLRVKSGDKECGKADLDFSRH